MTVTAFGTYLTTFRHAWKRRTPSTLTRHADALDQALAFYTVGKGVVVEIHSEHVSSLRSDNPGLPREGFE